MAGEKFNIADKFAAETGAAPTEEAPAEETTESTPIEISGDDLTQMRSLKDAGDYAGLGEYVSKLI